MAGSSIICLVIVLMTVVALPNGASAKRGSGLGSNWDPFIRSAVDLEDEVDYQLGSGTRWALLVAGSKDYKNYRHQANVCHAYQILRKGGLKDENIVVFMYDDIATSDENPRPGVIINHPEGEDVYAGVPKDYTGDAVTAENFYSVLLGNKSAVKGGSGKVIDSKPNDRIFLFYTDHGGAGTLGMPEKPYVVANDFIEVLKEKHATGTYKEMVMYLEACDSGSVFIGLLPDDLNIYAISSTNALEFSYIYYCPDTIPPSPPEYTVCLGDTFSVAWLEDSDTHNLKKDTLEQQINRVKNRTSTYGTYVNGSHVMEFGTKSIKHEKVYLYQGFNPATANLPANRNQYNMITNAVNQRDADLMYLWQKYKRSPISKRAESLNKIAETLRHMSHLDSSVDMIGVLLFGPQKGRSILRSTRGHGLPVVDDWDCLKSMTRLFEKHCGLLTEDGLKHMRAFANICNTQVEMTEVEEVVIATCAGKNIGPYASNGVFSV
ncbi:vacuolar-processing enzyme-like [Bidens hawaiensis]|uniref:vacuolar-processing enzyme-like n=1 Tax=Bidens hawaiensis TaxID=980011 RepID=UPI00404A4411